MRKVFSFLAFLTLAACNQQTASTAETTAKPTAIDEAKSKEIFDRHFKAFRENDLDAIMADYADEAVLITPDTTYVGSAAIRKGFEGAFQMFPKDSTTYQVVKTVIKNDLAYVIWNSKSPKLALTYATDSFVIQDGKIIRQTYAGH
jgi:ketosteroid isomerase-like protein